MERLGIATSAEIEPDTLADRLLAEVTAENGIVVWPPMIGAWSRIEPARVSRPIGATGVADQGGGGAGGGARGGAPR
jgi:hypothetical protein